MQTIKWMVFLTLSCFLVGCDKFEWLDVQLSPESKPQLEAIKPASIICTGSVLNRINLSVSIRSTEPFSETYVFLVDKASLEDEKGDVILNFHEHTQAGVFQEIISPYEYRMGVKNFNELKRLAQNATKPLYLRLWFKNAGSECSLRYCIKRKRS